MNTRLGRAWQRSGDGPSLQCPVRLSSVRIGLALGLLGLLLAQSGQGGDQGPGPFMALPQLLRVGQPIQEADRALRRARWIPAPAGAPLPMERTRAGNPLTSLSGCSGSGSGFCRYDYRRGDARLSVISVPAPAGGAGGGRVLRWSDARTGRTWGHTPGLEMPGDR